LIWGFSAVAALAGLILGCFFRVPALLALTLAIIIGTGASAWIAELPAGTAAQRGLTLLVASYIGYFLGLFVSAVLQRHRARS
jgi:hypothetical protein